MRSSANCAAERRDRRAGRLRWLGALALALALHALALGFRPMAAADAAETEIQARRIRMFPLDLPATGQLSLHHWYRWQNPLHFAKPTSLVFAAVPVRPQAVNLAFAADRAPAELRPGGFAPLSSDPTPLAGRVAAQWPAVLRAGTAPPPPAPDPASFPRWQRDGLAWPQLLADPEAARGQALAAGVLLPTVLEVRLAGPLFFPRIRIHAGCGDEALDALAVQALLQAAGRLEGDCGQCAGPCYIAVFWRPPPPTATVEVAEEP